MTIGITACSTGTASVVANGLIKKASQPKSISYEDYEAKLELENNNQVDEAFQKAFAEFANKSTSKLLVNQQGNTVYSPISLYFALALLASGADSTTKEELYTVMGIEDKDLDYLTEQTGKLYRRLYSDNEAGTLKIGNSLWLENNFKFLDDYVNTAADKFYSSIYHVDFKQKATADLMSSWVSESTNGLIKPDIQLSDAQVLTIMNTVYFKDRFVDEFNKGLTKKDIFNLEDGNSIKVDFMNKKELQHPYVKTDEYISTKLNFINNATMTFVLPNEGIDVDALIGDSSKVAEMFQTESTGSADITFKVPKFDYGSKFDLVEMLNSLGMTEAFEETADFSKISEEDLFVSGVKQEAQIFLDEEGAMAAAFTQVDVNTTSMPMDSPEKIEFNLDRPFIYGITSRDGTLLFVGVCKNPDAGK